MLKDKRRPAKRAHLESGQQRWWLILALLLVSGCLAACNTNASTITSPPTPPVPRTTVAAGPLHAFIQTFDGAFTITLDITPNRSGPNYFRARVMNSHTHQPVAHSTLTLYTTMQDMPMGTDAVVLKAGAAGEFSATSAVLSMGGHWAIGIVLQTPDHVMHKAGVSFVMPQ